MNFKHYLSLTVFLCVFISQTTAQETSYFKASIGLNIIDNSNESTRLPWGIENAAFENPVVLGLDYQANEEWSFGLNASFNTLEEKGVDSDFYGINVDANYYFLYNTNRQFFDIYGIMGGGFYHAFEETGITLAPGAGVNYWFSEFMGINLTARANFQLNGENGGVPEVGNFYQYTIGLIWRLGKEF
ncbi:outer membrane beta-barrel protein [Bizionia paragorgiae]|uniref:outer membrane beta-barrel protein n=1 Tax=Bizionia paragorgiae TaxID=283786 RepID=UPI003A8C8CA6